MGAKNDKTDKPQILIVGNPAHQIFLQRHHEAKSGGYERYPESYKDKLDENKTEKAESSINTLTRTILEALDDYPGEPYEKAKPEDYTRKYKKHIAELKKRTGIRFVFKIQQKLGNVKTRSELTSILEFFPPKSPPNDRDVKVLRVKERYYNTHKEEKPRSFISKDRFTIPPLALIFSFFMIDARR